MSRAEHTFTFYYRAEENGQDFPYKTQMCKYPQRTKAWKELDRMLNKGEVHTIGYEAL
jgi:hypothetical protein